MTTNSDDILKRNLVEVRERIQNACNRAGRSADEVTLVAVTKTVGALETATLISLGVTDIGENRPLDAANKFKEIPEAGYRRHFIGHLQRNKARAAVEAFDYFHSVDSVRLARELQKEAARCEKQLPVLVQVNIAAEQQKHGFEPSEVGSVIAELEGFDRLSVDGLMCMAPIVDSPEQTRTVFAGLRELREALIGDYPKLEELSMGMTQDFEIAIEEGATMVRVGSALFRNLAT